MAIIVFQQIERSQRVIRHGIIPRFRHVDKHVARPVYLIVTAFPGVVTRADNQRIDADISLCKRRSRNIRIENERTAIHGQSTNGLLSHVYRCGIFTVRLQHRVSKRSGVVAFQSEGTVFQLGNTGEFSPCCMGKAKHLVGG